MKFGNPIATVAVSGTIPVSGTVGVSGIANPVNVTGSTVDVSTVSGPVDVTGSNVEVFGTVETSPTPNLVAANVIDIAAANTPYWIIPAISGQTVRIYSMLITGIPSTGSPYFIVQQTPSLVLQPTSDNIAAAFLASSAVTAPLPFIIPPSGVPLAVGNGLAVSMQQTGFIAYTIVYNQS